MANTAKVTWVDGALLVAEAGSGHTFTMDGSPDVGGRNLGSRPMEVMLMGLGDMVCPDYPDISTCYDSTPSPYLVGAGPLAPGQSRISSPGGITAAGIAQQIQSAMRQVVSSAPALQPAYSQFSASYDPNRQALVLASGTTGPASTVVVTPGPANDATGGLKLGVANGGGMSAGVILRRTPSASLRQSP